MVGNLSISALSLSISVRLHDVPNYTLYSAMKEFISLVDLLLEE